MRRNPEINADTHHPSGFSMTVDGPLPTIATPAIDVANQTLDKNVYIQTIGIPDMSSDTTDENSRRLISGGVEMRFWRVKSLEDIQDYEVIFNPTLDEETEQKLLEIHDYAENGYERIATLIGLTRGHFTPKEGLSLRVNNIPVFYLQPKIGPVIYSHLEEVQGREPENFFEYRPIFTSKPFGFECIAATFEMGENEKIDDVVTEGQLVKAYHIISGLRFGSLSHDELETKLVALIDQGITSPKQLRPFVEVYMKLKEVPKST